MSFQWEERHSRQTEQAQMWAGKRDPKGFALREQVLKPIPPEGARSIAPEALPPFSDLVEINCQDCGGSGHDAGGINPQEMEDCCACQGSGKEIVLRNYLAEAFRLAADRETKVQLERAHLVALTAYARQTVSALLMSQPEVA